MGNPSPPPRAAPTRFTGAARRLRAPTGAPGAHPAPPAGQLCAARTSSRLHSQAPRGPAGKARPAAGPAPSPRLGLLGPSRTPGRSMSGGRCGAAAGRGRARGSGASPVQERGSVSAALAMPGGAAARSWAQRGRAAEGHGRRRRQRRRRRRLRLTARSPSAGRAAWRAGSAAPLPAAGTRAARTPSQASRQPRWRKPKAAPVAARRSMATQCASKWTAAGPRSPWWASKMPRDPGGSTASCSGSSPPCCSRGSTNSPSACSAARRRWRRSRKGLKLRGSGSSTPTATSGERRAPAGEPGSAAPSNFGGLQPGFSLSLLPLRAAPRPKLCQGQR